MMMRKNYLLPAGISLRLLCQAALCFCLRPASAGPLPADSPWWGGPPTSSSSSRAVNAVFDLQEEEEEEGENSDAEQQVPEATERKEHDSCGQTGLESVQSECAVELAGAAPEKEQGKEVKGPLCLASCPLGGPLLPVQNQVLFSSNWVVCDVFLWLTSKISSPVH